jgi:glycosyltransferase involved in cell wall biosynthesis
MRIGLVCPRYFPSIGGIETQVKEISERFVRKGSEVDVLTTDPSGKHLEEEIINGVKVRRFKSWAPHEAYYFSSNLRKYLDKEVDNYDIVHAHGYHALPALYVAQSKKQKGFVFSPHYHGRGHTFFRNILHVPYKFIGKKIFEIADRIICVSDYEKRLVVSRFEVENSKIKVIPNGINLTELRASARTNNESKTILYVGRLEKYKRINNLVEALGYLDSDIGLEIVGKGPAKEDLLELGNKLKLNGRLRFLEDLTREELLKRYVNAVVFVSLSKYEAYGISVAEALASGTPCVLANSSALMEWIDGRNCFGVDDPDDSRKVAEVISDVMGRRVEGVRLADWDDVSSAVLDIYEQCCSSKYVGNSG